MPNLKRIQVSADIAAPVARVFQIMLDPDGYRDWTSTFAEGSYYEGSWRQGEKIKFLGPSGGGMLAEVAELRTNEFHQRRKRIDCEIVKALSSSPCQCTCLLSCASRRQLNHNRSTFLHVLFNRFNHSRHLERCDKIVKESLVS